MQNPSIFTHANLHICKKKAVIFQREIKCDYYAKCRSSKTNTADIGV